MTKKLNWRLGKLPTPEEVAKLIKDEIITKEEAREILFSEINDETRETSSLQEEIIFLKKLIDKLSDRSHIIETIKYIEKPYWTHQWYAPYATWCLTGLESGSASAVGYIQQAGDNSLVAYISGDNQISFAEIKSV